MDDRVPVIEAYVAQEGSWWKVGLVGVTANPPFGPYQSEQEARDAIPAIAAQIESDLTYLGHLRHILPTLALALEELGVAPWIRE